MKRFFSGICLVILSCLMISCFSLLSAAQKSDSGKSIITSADLKIWFAKKSISYSEKEIAKDFLAYLAAQKYFVAERISEKYSSRFWKPFLEDYVKAFKKIEKKEFKKIKKATIEEAEGEARSK